MLTARRGYEACTGCSLCLLVCPVWRATRDIRLTPHGRAKALQHGAGAQDLAASVDACALCGACEPACPADIGLVGMIMDLRAELARRDPGRVAQVAGDMDRRAQGPASAGPTAACLLVPGRAFARHPGVAARILERLQESGAARGAADDGADIAVALESGASVPQARLAAFLGPLREAKRLIVADGMLIRALRGWLPGLHVESLGAALSAALRGRLRAGDLYVIEPRAYHADQERLVKYYDAMRVSLGLHMNLDLQRMAIPTTAGAWCAGRAAVDPRDQARWILEGNACSRVVVEDAEDIAVFSAVTDKPVLHLAELT
jgi:ferredoxin